MVYLNKQVEKVVQELERLEEVEGGLDVAPVRKKGRFLSDTAAERRKKIPTGFKNGKVQISARVASSRRKETYQAAIEIHGGSVNSCAGIPAEVGLIDTVATKCSKHTLIDVLLSSKKFTKVVIPKIYKSCHC